MKELNNRQEKRPRMKPKQKREALFSTDRVEAPELSAFFTSNLVKKKDPFER
jgi:hypothetical protein